MSDIIYVNDDNFEAEVINSVTPVLVDFSATWCAPCKRQLPILEKFADDTNKIKVCKIDIDDSPEITKKLGIRSVPTLLLFNNGKQLGSQVGLSSLGTINDFVTTKVA